MAKYSKGSYRRYAKRWRRAYKRYFRKYRPKHVSLGKPNASTVITGKVECCQYLSASSMTDTFNPVLTICPLYHNFTGYTGVVNQHYGICGAYGNFNLRQAFTRYQQCRIKGMYVRVKAMLGESPAGSAMGTDWTPFVVWDRQAQFKDIDNRAFVPGDVITQATQQGMPMWPKKTYDVWETKCVPKDLAERSCWLDCGTFFNFHEGSGCSMTAYESTLQNPDMLLSSACSCCYLTSGNSTARTRAPPDFLPMCKIAFRVVPYPAQRNYLFEVSVKYIMEFRNPGNPNDATVNSYLLLTDDLLGPDPLTKSVEEASSPPLDKE